MQTYIKHPSPQGDYKDTTGATFLLIEVKAGAQVYSTHPRLEGADEAAVALAAGLTKIEKPKPDRPGQPAPALTAAQQARKNLNDGWTSPAGFTLAAQDQDQNQFNKLLTMVNTALAAGAITADTPQTIADKAGVLHTMPTGQYVQLMLGYGQWVGEQWLATRS